MKVIKKCSTCKETWGPDNPGYEECILNLTHAVLRLTPIENYVVVYGMLCISCGDEPYSQSSYENPYGEE